VAAAGLLLLALWQIGGGLYIHLKAQLAQVLLARAWAATLAGGQEERPWAWADTWPVARLTVPALGVDEIVLAGDSGRTLAFGPGHLSNTPLPGKLGHSILGGHRDTHFAFLQGLKPGMTLAVQRQDGQWQDYQVTASEIMDHRQARLLPAEGRTVLSLVTCYPFDSLMPGGPLRYVVSAEAP
jgi:sortase A